MKIRKSEIFIDDRNWGTSVHSVARELGVSPSFISRIKNNKVVISESLYFKIIKVLTKLVNNDIV